MATELTATDIRNNRSGALKNKNADTKESYTQMTIWKAEALFFGDADLATHITEELGVMLQDVHASRCSLA